MIIYEVKDIPARFSILDNGINRKIFTYFNAAADGSFALHSYLGSNTTGVLTLGPDFQGTKINIDQVDHKEFTIHKFNFHKSGVITAKNKNGIKFSSVQESSIDLRLVKDIFFLGFLIPKTLAFYPIAEETKLYVEMGQGDEHLLPPIIQFYICHKKYDMEKEFISRLKRKINWFTDHNILSQFNLILYISIRRNGENGYPIDELFGVSLLKEKVSE